MTDQDFKKLQQRQIAYSNSVEAIRVARMAIKGMSQGTQLEVKLVGMQLLWKIPLDAENSKKGIIRDFENQIRFHEKLIEGMKL
jgi:uncharacterized membrane protein YecN with MAPEG domain